jgi:hypothetical protein
MADYGHDLEFGSYQPAHLDSLALLGVILAPEATR